MNRFILIFLFFVSVVTGSLGQIPPGASPRTQLGTIPSNLQAMNNSLMGQVSNPVYTGWTAGSFYYSTAHSNYAWGADEGPLQNFSSVSIPFNTWDSTRPTQYRIIVYQNNMSGTVLADSQPLSITCSNSNGALAGYFTANFATIANPGASDIYIAVFTDGHWGPQTLSSLLYSGASLNDSAYFHNVNANSPSSFALNSVSSPNFNMYMLVYQTNVTTQEITPLNYTYQVQSNQWTGSYNRWGMYEGVHKPFNRIIRWFKWADNTVAPPATLVIRYRDTGSASPNANGPTGTILATTTVNLSAQYPTGIPFNTIFPVTIDIWDPVLNVAQINTGHALWGEYYMDSHVSWFGTNIADPNSIYPQSAGWGPNWFGSGTTIPNPLVLSSQLGGTSAQVPYVVYQNINHLADQLPSLTGFPANLQAVALQPITQVYCTLPAQLYALSGTQFNLYTQNYLYTSGVPLSFYNTSVAISGATTQSSGTLSRIMPLNNDWQFSPTEYDAVTYTFNVSGVTTTPVFGTQFTNNGQTFTITSWSISAGSGTFLAVGTGAPSSSGTLTKISGTGDATDSFSSFTGSTSTPYTLTISVWFGGTLCGTFTTTLNVISTTAGGSASRKLVAIGDSTTSQGWKLQQVVRDIAAGTNYTLTPIGSSFTHSTQNSDGATSQVNSEGYGGWSFALFNASGSPFWFSSAFNFATYLTNTYKFTVSSVTGSPVSPGAGSTYTNNGNTYTCTVGYNDNISSGGTGACFLTGSSTPTSSGTLTKASGTGPSTIVYSAESLNTMSSGDMVTIQLGDNDLSSQLTDAAALTQIASMSSYLQTMITSIKSAVSGVRIAIIMTDPCGNQDAFGAGGDYTPQWRLQRNINLWRSSILQLWQGTTANVDVIDPGASEDNINGNFTQAVPYNSYSPFAYFQQYNSVHPGMWSYWQAGDCIAAYLKFKG